MQFDGTGSWVGRLLIGTVLAIGALIALAAVAGAQTSGDNSDPNSGTSENSDGGSSDGGSGDGDGDGSSGDGDDNGDGGSGDGNGGSGDGDGDGGSGSGDGDGNGDGGSGDGDGGSGNGDGGSGDGNAVDPEEARIAACASRYHGYQAGWAEQTCRYPNLVWTRTISCVVNRVYSERATGPTQEDQGRTWTQMERVVDYACTWDWRWFVAGGGPPPIPESEMIKPHEAETRVEPTKYRRTYWQSGVWTRPISQVVVRPSESANPGSGSGSGSGDGDSGDGGSGSSDGDPGSSDGDSDGGSGSGSDPGDN